MRQCRETNCLRHIYLIANGGLPRTCSIGCPIGSFGVPHKAVVRAGANGNGKQLGPLILAPVIVAPLTWRIGMTAPVLLRSWGRFTPKRKARLLAGRSKILR